jgi:hypothetical protein
MTQIYLLASHTVDNNLPLKFQQHSIYGTVRLRISYKHNAYAAYFVGKLCISRHEGIKSKGRIHQIRVIWS